MVHDPKVQFIILGTNYVTFRIHMKLFGMIISVYISKYLGTYLILLQDT